MPIYEYQCAQCGNVSEAIQSFSDPPLTTCTACSGKLHKLISHSSFHLKGSGWYVTDYAGRKSKTGPAAASGAKPPEGESAAASAGGTPAETKPASPSAAS
jgi:putative FmdB family regulatory protein